MVLLDTHIWIWWLHQSGNLTERERRALDALASERNIAISWVSVWEAEMLERKQRVRFGLPFGEWLSIATDSSFCKVIPADSAVVVAQRSLPENFHSDPADRLIAATSILHRIPLFTRDERIVLSGACEIWTARS